MKIPLISIGNARNNEKNHTGNWAEVVTDIVLDEQYKNALDGLAEYSHLVVVYFMHQEKTCLLRHVPQGKVGTVPEVGIFACRCSHRPNPIGVSTVKILSIHNNIIRVKGLDVVGGTPILDIKPYTPQYDRPKNVKVPSWVSKLDY